MVMVMLEGYNRPQSCSFGVEPFFAIGSSLLCVLHALGLVLVKKVA